MGEPASCQWQGHFFQLADILGVEEETGYTLNVDKYNWQDHAHFITEDSGDAIDFGEGKKNIFALESATVLRQIDKGVQLAVNTFGQGRGVYISGLPYSFAKQPPAVPGDSVGGFGGGENSPLVFHKLQCRSACLCKKRQILCRQQHV